MRRSASTKRHDGDVVWLLESITETEFRSYERVRVCGRVNMYDLRLVSKYSLLSEEKLFLIVQEYGALRRRYPDVLVGFQELPSEEE